MALLGIAILILVIIIFFLVAWYVVRNFTQLAINAIIGLVTLLIVNFFSPHAVCRKARYRI